MRPANGLYKEIAQHIVDWERILSQRALLFARRANLTPQSVDGEALADNANANRRQIGELTSELKLVRASSKAMFDSFEDGQRFSILSNIYVTDRKSFLISFCQSLFRSILTGE